MTPRVRIVPTADLSQVELEALRRLLEDAFCDAVEGGLTDEDWDHTLGGVHVLCDEDGIVSHAAVVPRVLEADGRTLRTGYVEGVATAAPFRGLGYASSVMREAARIVCGSYELGALATGIPDFYTGLGWEVWAGPTSANSPEGLIRTPDEDGAVMILRTGATQALDVSGSLTCDWRAGDVW
jgi:aminoglycoside 2'-N-acetyltransferase I